MQSSVVCSGGGGGGGGISHLTLCIPQDCFYVEMTDDGCLVNCKTLIRPHHDHWRQGPGIVIGLFLFRGE